MKLAFKVGGGHAESASLRRLGAFLGLVTLSASLLQACGGEDTQDPGATGAPLTSIAFAADGAVAASEIDPAVARGGTVQLAVFSIFDSLYVFDKNGVPQPDLVTEHESDPTGIQHTFKIRSGVTFHDGSPLTAADVKFSLDRAAGLDPSLPAPRAASYLPKVASVEVVDDTTFVVNLAAPSAVLLNGLAHTPGLIVPKAYMEKVGPEGFAAKPIGSGAYEFVSLTEGQSMTLKRNDDYWGDPAAFKDVTVNFVDDVAARLARLESGDVDFISDVDPSQIETLKSKGFEVKVVPAGNNFAIGLQMEVMPELADPRVGQAFNYAVDKEAIIQAIYQDTMKPIGSLDPSNVTEGIDPYPYDPDKAKSLLEDAGWDFSRTLKVALPSGIFLNGDSVARAVVSNFKEIGINLEIVTMEPAEWLEQRDAHTLPTELTFFNLSNSLFNGTGSLAVVNKCADSGYTFWCDPKLDDMIADAQQTLDLDERRAQEQTVFEYSHDNPSAIFIGQFSQICAMTGGFTWDPVPGQEKVVLRDFSTS